MRNSQDLGTLVVVQPPATEQMRSLRTYLTPSATTPSSESPSMPSWLWVFGIDAEPVGLDESAVTDGVTITAK